MRADYFDDANLTDWRFSRTEAAVDFDWGSGSPDPGIDPDTFSVRWSGQVQAQFTETYTFRTSSDDGVRLWVNGRLLIDHWDDHSSAVDAGEIGLVAGRRYDIVLESYEAGGLAEARLAWASPSTPHQVIPRAQLFPGERGGLLREVYADIPGSQVSDLTASPSFPGRPSSASMTTGFVASADVGRDSGQRVHGLIHAPMTGTYTFWLFGDDSAELFLSNSEDAGAKRPIAAVSRPADPQPWDFDPRQRSAPIPLVAGQAYYIEALQKGGDGGGYLSVGWTLPDGRFEGPIAGHDLAPLVPTVRLYAISPTTSEGGASATFEVMRDGGSLATPLQVSYTAGGTATPGSDFEVPPAFVTIPAGAASATITIDPINDDLAEGKETIVLTLQDGPGYDLGPVSSMTATVALGDDDLQPPPGGGPVVADDVLNRFTRIGAAYGTSQVVAVTGPGFTQALQVTTTTRPPSVSNFQVNQRNTAAVTRGDVLYLEFYARSVGVGPANFRAVFERAVTPFNKSLDYSGTVGTNWTRVQLPFAADDNYAPNTAQFNFQQGFDPQSIQIGGVTLVNYGAPSKLVADDALAAFTGANLAYGSSRTVAAGGPGFAQALEVTTAVRPPSITNFQVAQPTLGPITQGDVLYLQFYARSAGAGPASIQVVVERAVTPFTKSLITQISVGPDWTLYRFAFNAAETYAASGARLGFQLGFAPQTVQVGGVVLVNVSRSPSAMPADVLDGFGQPDAAYGSSQVVAATGPGFSQALQVTTTTRPPDVDDFQVGQPTTAPLRQGTPLYLQFYARSAGPAPANFRVVFGEVGGPADESLRYDGSAGTAWSLFRIPFTAARSSAAGGARLGFQLGFAPQTIQVGGLLLVDAGAALSVGGLPRSEGSVTYGGRDGDAAWRVEARARIEEQRTGSLTVTVTDEDGRPIDGAAVHVRQLRHEFGFGSAVNANLLVNGTGPDADAYRALTQRVFNTATIENSLKWPDWLSNRQLGINAAHWVVGHGLDLRGHNLIWPSRTFMPASVWGSYDSILAAQGPAAAADYLRRTILDHITDEAATLGGLVMDWDVVNEPFAHHDALDILGNAAMVDWYKAARAADPNARLYLNDYALFTSNGGDAAHRNNFLAWIDLLRSNGAPIDGIGEQGHYTTGNLTDIDRLPSVMQPFIATGLPIAITEFDFSTTDEQLQADYIRDYMTMMFSQPSVNQFILWGFWEGTRGRQLTASLYRLDFSAKPSGQAFEDLVFGDWWTDTRGTTAGGRYTARGYQGDYEVVVVAGGRTRTVRTTIGPGSNSLTVGLASGDW